MITKRQQPSKNAVADIPYDPKGEWWTAPCDADNGSLVMVTVRSDTEHFRQNKRFNIRVTINWQYASEGMPEKAVSEQMAKVTECLAQTFDKDPIAVMTGIYTGDGVREWVFYTLSLNIFGRKLNEALSALPVLPLNISAENDADWEEYAEACKMRID